MGVAQRCIYSYARAALLSRPARSCSSFSLSLFLMIMKTATVIVSLALALLHPSIGAKSMYDLTALDAMGNEVAFQQYKGKARRAVFLSS